MTARVVLVSCCGFQKVGLISCASGRIVALLRFLEPERNSCDEMVRHGRGAEGATRDVQIEIGVGKFVFSQQRPVPRQAEVDTGESLYAGAVNLIFFKWHSADV